MAVEEGWEKVGRAAYYPAALFAALACLISFNSMIHHLKDYRRPHVQRLILRIIWMVPIYAISSIVALSSRYASEVVEPLRDLYEAFVIYVFFNLLVEYLGGERHMLATLARRLPLQHKFPVNLWPRMRNHPWDVADPPTFLILKRGILQFVFAKPIFTLLTLLLKHQNAYSEGYISASNAYVWVNLLYNISVSWSLYCLVMFFIATRQDLVQYRPLPKFLCIKAIIFFTFWQSFVISLLVYAGLIQKSGDYSANNISTAMQDLLICLEMVPAAIAHDRAFTHLEYKPLSTNPHGSMPVCGAKMSTRAAFRDAFGIRDIASDIVHTLRGTRFAAESAADSILARLSSRRRGQIVKWLHRIGLRRRFGRSGRVVSTQGPGYYDAHADHVTRSGLASPFESTLDEDFDNEWGIATHDVIGATERAALLGGATLYDQSSPVDHSAHSRVNTIETYGGLSVTLQDSQDSIFIGEPDVDENDEVLYRFAKSCMPSGDYSYMVVDDEPLGGFDPVQDPRGGIHTRIAQEHAKCQGSTNASPTGSVTSNNREMTPDSNSSTHNREKSPSRRRVSHPYRGITQKAETDAIPPPPISSDANALPSRAVTHAGDPSLNGFSPPTNQPQPLHQSTSAYAAAAQGFRRTAQPGPPPEIFSNL